MPKVFSRLKALAAPFAWAVKTRRWALLPFLLACALIGAIALAAHVFATNPLVYAVF